MCLQELLPSSETNKTLSSAGPSTARNLRLPSVFSYGETFPVDDAFFRRRFEDADDLRLRCGVDPLVSRRIYSEADFLPGLIVDRYGEYLVVQSLTQAADRLQPLYTAILQDRYQPRSIVFRNDSKVRELEGLPLVQSWIGEEPPQSVIVDEDGKLVEIPLSAGQKTGSYLDQRENHRAARRYARGLALDCFCYGGGFALQLAEVCDRVDAVDLSSAAVQLARSNAARNGLQNIICKEANVFDFLREKKSGALQHHRFGSSRICPKQGKP